MSADKYPDYVEPRLDEIEMWAMDGVSQEEMARRLDVSYKQFRNHRDAHPELKEALSMTKGKADALVMKALRESAIGAKKEERVFGFKKNKCTGQREERLIERRETKMPANPQAAKIWLEKRVPETWSSKPEPQSIMITTQPAAVDLSALSNDELERYRELAAKVSVKKEEQK